MKTTVNGSRLTAHELKVYIRTFGCQMNTRDSEIVIGMLEEHGYKHTDDPKEADIVIFNTCSVREHAEQRALSALGYLLRRGAKHKKRIFGVMGCVAQHKQEKIFKSLPKLDFICGSSDIYNIPLILSQIINEGKVNVVSVSKKDRGKRSIKNINPSYREKEKEALVNIMYGCNNFCSYCIVPYVRGEEVSRPVKDIVEEITDLVSKDITHITLLGQNVNSYNGKDGKEDIDLIGLLKQLNKIEGIKKISFMTSHPKDAKPSLFKAMRDLNKVDKHLHLAMQSGSDKILKLMNRGYTSAKFIKLVEDFREIVHDGKISTDIIVGFPTETEEDFNQTKEVVEKLRFDNAYIFKYSPRPPAKSSEMADDVLIDVKKRRHSELLELQREISREKKGKKFN
ncbi:MAG: tRNA (N6-isopentenyl adenosine(37)-C2)-methylthiotransferase MiaB [Candidatus Omnitrophica bacterium]|nr:tRNA (N6-isopentenyl adenosine(37)-C2)-methylthiotransferase MiaB [Candidatus Omnitrophota bacterium]